MSVPLKDIYNVGMINSLSTELKKIYVEFDSENFTNAIFIDEWEDKELKQRMRHITVTLHQYLPQNYNKALDVLISIADKFKGLEALIFSDFVECYGLDNYDISVKAMEYFTQFCSSEFAVRPFIKKYSGRMMKQMESWAESKNHHVRRLASEGCRPRLPWAMALPEFKKNPEPVTNIINKLICDESEYVRRSVANNLNDISKDNPLYLKKIAQKWIDHSPETDWVIKHACRTLLKQGDANVLQFFGFYDPKHISIRNLNIQKSVALGDSMEFSFTVESISKHLGKLRMEYAMDFVKANGKQSRKIFKIAEGNYQICRKEISKRHSFRKITTRNYYPGVHHLSIIVNGRIICGLDFELKV